MTASSITTDHNAHPPKMEENRLPNARVPAKLCARMVRRSPQTSTLLAVLCLLSLLAIAVNLVQPVASQGAAASQVMQLLRTALTAVLAATLLAGPGIAIRAWRPGWLASMTYLALPGLALLIVAGLVDWALTAGFHLSLPLITDPWLVAVIVVTGFTALRRPEAVNAAVSVAERHVLVVYGIVLSVVVAKALWSVGPVGELYGGTVSRTLEVGDRSDSRISYHVVQLIAHGENPYSRAGSANFIPYTFADRGPLAGIAAAPVTFATGPDIPVGLPDQPWVPFDPQGFAAYRIAMEAMLLTVVFAVFGLSRTLVRRDSVALLAVLFAATTPFIVHEAFFTWPKLLAAELVLVGVQLLLAVHPVRAGVATAAGYLAHPLVLLTGPTMGLLALGAGWRSRPRDSAAPGSAQRQPLPRALIAGAAFAAGGLVVLAGWRILNGSHVSDQFRHFLPYVFQTNGQPSLSLIHWIKGRVSSVGATFVPLWVLVAQPTNPSLNAVGHLSPTIIHFYFQYWTSFPFGVGITVLPWVVAGLVRFTRRHPWISLQVVVLPPVLFALYWGSFVSGLMREGLQVWMVGLTIVFAWETWGAGAMRGIWRLLRYALLARCLETFLMLVLPAAVTQGRLLGETYTATDAVAVAVMLAGMAALGWLLWRALLAWATERASSAPMFDAA
jgi:hypothetical protein